MYYADMKNQGLGLIEFIIIATFIALAGIFSYKAYFAPGEKAVSETEKIYENTEQNAALSAAAPSVKAESVHARKAKELEGKIFIDSVISAQRAYEAVNGRFFYTGWTRESRELGINTKGNRYFKEFSVERKAGGFIVKVKGSGELEGIILSSE